MQLIDEAFSAWSRAHAQLLEAECKWGEIVVTGSDEERTAMERRIRVLRERSEVLLRRADEALSLSERPRA